MTTKYLDGSYRDGLSGDPLSTDSVIGMIADELRSLPPGRQQQAISAVETVIEAIWRDMLDQGEMTWTPISSDSDVQVATFRQARPRSS